MSEVEIERDQASARRRRKKQRETLIWDGFVQPSEEKERWGKGEMREIKMRVEARERKKEGEEGEEGKGKKGRKRREGGRKKFFRAKKMRNFCEVLKIETRPFLKCSFTSRVRPSSSRPCSLRPPPRGPQPLHGRLKQNRLRRFRGKERREENGRRREASWCCWGRSARSRG